jgi:hypothetical protein
LLISPLTKYSQDFYVRFSYNFNVTINHAMISRPSHKPEEFYIFEQYVPFKRFIGVKTFSYNVHESGPSSEPV